MYFFSLPAFKKNILKFRALYFRKLLTFKHILTRFMKLLFTTLLFSFFAVVTAAQGPDLAIHKRDTTKKIQTVEASCGQCQLGLVGTGCDLAVRIDGKSYFVDGTKIDDHGDAHAKDGFCEAIRKAEVQGEIINNRFKATYFKLIAAIKKE